MQRLLGNILLFLGAVLVVLYLLSLAMPHAARSQHAAPANVCALNGGGQGTDLVHISLVCTPQIGPAFIDQVLTSYASPAQGMGQTLYNLGNTYHISSDAILALFGTEDLFGTRGEAQVSHSPGNLRCLGSGYEDLHPTCQGGYAWFPSWQAGFEAQFRLLRRLYVDTWGITNVPQMIARYAPAADGNDDASYLRNVIAFLRAWYAGEVRP